MAEHEIPADLLDKLADAINDCQHSRKVMDWEDVLLGYSRAVLAALAEWADGALLDPATWTRVRAERVLCPVHGSAACPEDYMLKSDGTPWADYASYWHEAMRCGRRPTLTREDP